MPYIKKLNTFISLPLAVKLLFLEALFTSAVVKVCLKFFSFKIVAGWLGKVNRESDLSPDNNNINTIQRIKVALDLCNRYSFWRTECYTLSLTGKLLLKRRNISSTLYIGFNKTPEGIYKGHAWLKVHDIDVSGCKEAESFIIHSKFS